MLKKIAVAALISSFAIASFAQVGAATSAPAKAATPGAEQKVDAAKSDMKVVPKTKAKGESKAEEKAEGYKEGSAADKAEDKAEHKHMMKHHKKMMKKAEEKKSDTPAATK